MRNPYQQQSPHQSVAVLIRQVRMIGKYDNEDHRWSCFENGPTMNLVITFSKSSSLWTVLRVMIMYASVDEILFLPILILVNVISIWHVLSVFTDAAA